MIKHAWKALLGLLALIGLPTLWVVYQNTVPEIHPQTAQAEDPFKLHFSIHNSSDIFNMTNMIISCELLPVKTEKKNLFSGFAIQDMTPPQSIQSGGVIEYTCPLNKAFSDIGAITNAEIALNINYDIEFMTLHKFHSIQSTIFHWDDSSKQWIEGRVIN